MCKLNKLLGLFYKHYFHAAKKIWLQNLFKYARDKNVYYLLTIKFRINIEILHS